MSGILCQSSAWCPLNEDSQPRQFALAFNLNGPLTVQGGGNRLYSHAVTVEGAGGGSVGESWRGKGWLRLCSPQEDTGDRSKALHVAA